MDGIPWCTIESDPGVFTELMTAIGVKNVQVEELWSLDEQLFQQIKYVVTSDLERSRAISAACVADVRLGGLCHHRPVYGLIFLFKWRPDDSREARNVVTDFDPTQLFFARQVITNACATQAILSILLNCKEIDLGPELTQFKDFTQYFDPEVRAMSTP